MDRNNAECHDCGKVFHILLAGALCINCFRKLSEPQGLGADRERRFKVVMDRRGCQNPYYSPSFCGNSQTVTMVNADNTVIYDFKTCGVCLWNEPRMADFWNWPDIYLRSE